MMIETLGAATVSPSRVNEPAQQVERKKEESKQQPQVDSKEQSVQVQPEELLQQINSITEDGLYAVRFERNDQSNQLVVKVIDRDTDEVIRQIPAEEILNLTEQLRELRGNVVDTVS